MSQDTNTTFVITGWNEHPVAEFEGGKLTRASVGVTYSGAIEGPGTVEYIMTYKSDGTADFLGYDYIAGTVGGRKGTFVLRQEGTFEGGLARAECTVVPGSGTGELAGLTGKGGYTVGHEGPHKMWFDYEL